MQSTEQTGNAQYDRGLYAFIQQLFTAYMCQALGQGLGTQMSKAEKAPALEELTFSGRKTIQHDVIPTTSYSEKKTKQNKNSRGGVIRTIWRG